MPAALSPSTLELLKGYSWPGNVRELRNVIERAAVMCAGDSILPEHLPMSVLSPAPRPPSTSSSVPARSGEAPNLQAELKEMERIRILQALERSGGNQSEAAKQLVKVAPVLSPYSADHRQPAPPPPPRQVFPGGHDMTFHAPVPGTTLPALPASADESHDPKVWSSMQVWEGNSSAPRCRAALHAGENRNSANPRTTSRTVTIRAEAPVPSALGGNEYAT